MDIKDKNNIQNLLDKFRNSSLSEEDINELYTLVNDKSADNKLGQYYGIQAQSVIQKPVQKQYYYMLKILYQSRGKLTIRIKSGPCESN